MATMDVKDATGSTVTIEKPLAPGAAAASASRPVTLSTENVAQLGSVTETAPASDTASSGLNGRLQRIAQNITSAITHLSTLAGAITSSRMAVNPISGQVGIAGGTGVDGATVPRVSLATNVALPAGTAVLGKVGIDQTTPGTTNAVSAVLTAGSATIGKLAANSGVDIGDVDVTSVPTDPFGANADAASATGSVSAKLRGIATALGVTALDLGSGTGGSRTLRTFPDTATVYPSPMASPTFDVTRPTDTTPYDVDDCWSNSTSAPTSGGYTFTGAARASGKSGIITDAVFATSADNATKLQAELWIFNTSVTNINDNSAFAVSDSEIKTCVAKIPFTMEDSGNNGFYHAQNLNIGFTCAGSADLRALIRVKNAYTPISGEVLTCTLKILQVD